MRYFYSLFPLCLPKITISLKYVNIVSNNTADFIFEGKKKLWTTLI